ncbi:hypothetical protein V8C86DRAFT_2687440, partial [Haematococcus lacustris]
TNTFRVLAVMWVFRRHCALLMPLGEKVHASICCLSGSPRDLGSGCTLGLLQESIAPQAALDCFCQAAGQLPFPRANPSGDKAMTAFGRVSLAARRRPGSVPGWPCLVVP